MGILCGGKNNRYVFRHWNELTGSYDVWQEAMRFPAPQMGHQAWQGGRFNVKNIQFSIAMG